MCSECGCRKVGSSRTVSPLSDRNVTCCRGRTPCDYRTSCNRRFGFVSIRRTSVKTLAVPSSGMLLPAMTSKQPVPPGVQPLGCREYMLTDGVAVKPHIEGEHVVQKIGHRRKGQVRRPFRLQEIQLRRRMRRQ